ncbi:hypothetical protein [Chitinophaga rhizophila]|uniref:Phage integrase SAM-like domain-containing protein n=1 Tax=Chitinophaga rhizophila TaxID=2866212 RepID=A0ABS7G782_9BACT|nr:hypothetical protein [Chitinophaga rhizophila]MBW8683500.1 hypothetical protein [Chitinophaga rhizophila]
MTIEKMNCTIKHFESLITTQDVEFCRQANGSYASLRFLMEDAVNNFKYNQDETHRYLKFDTTGLITQMIFEVDKTMSHLESDITKLTTKFIRHIESYFEKTYNIQFQPHRITGKDPLTIDSYCYVLQNIIQQLGSDLNVVSKTRTIGQFRRLFMFQRCKPHLTNNKIVMPDLQKQDSRLETLCYAISLFLYGNTRMTRELEAFKQQLTGNYCFEAKQITEVVSIKGYKNGRADLQFTTAELAAGFYQFYDLANPLVER